MKKIKLIALALAVCTLGMALASCAASGSIEGFAKKMGKKQSYSAKISITDEYGERETFEFQYDGNIQYDVENEYYRVEYDEGVYGLYEKTKDKKWVRTVYEDDVVDLGDAEDLWDPDNYEKVKGEKNTYKQKKNVIFDNFDDVEMTIDKDSCTIAGTITLDGETYGFKMIISDIGEIELELPELD